jgi:NADH-quinone oxidoreductase subunit L
LNGHLDHVQFTGFIPIEVGFVMLLSTIIVACGIGLAAWLYSRRPLQSTTEPDVLARAQPDIFYLLERKFFIDELYDATLVKLNAVFARTAYYLDRFVFDNIVAASGHVVVALSALNRLIDEFVVNLGFDKGCSTFRRGGKLLSFWQNGHVQRYLRFMAVVGAGIVLLLIWGWRR